MRALALSWKNLAAYPSGHPALVKSLQTVDQRLAELRGPAGEVVLGIASDGLIYGDVRIDSLAARKFAQALYTRGVAVLRMSSETNPGDTETFLRLLAAGVPSDEKRGLWEDLTAAGVININLQPVNYTAVRLTETLDEKKERESSLWDAILRALLEGRQFSDDGREVESRVDSAEELTRMINEYIASTVKASVPFDPDATFGIRMPVRAEEAFASMLSETVGQYIANAWGLKKQNSIQQALQLLHGLAQPLRGAVLRAVLHALANDETAGALLRDFSSELPGDEVLDAMRYLSSVERLSTHAISLLDSLTAVHASRRAEPPSQGLIGDLVRVFGDEDVDRFNPDDHGALLASAAIRIPHIPAELLGSMEQLGNSAETVGQNALLRQFAAMTLELLEDVESAPASGGLLKRLESIFRSHLNAGEFDEAREVTEHLRRIGKRSPSAVLRQAIEESLGRLAGGDAIADLIEILQTVPPETAPAIHRLMEALGPAVRRNLISALAEENNRSRRRHLFDFIASLGPAIVPDVVSFLADSRWYVVRNMIVLLRVVQDRSSLPELRKLARHPDLRVKLEALKSLFALDPEVPATLLDELLNHPDPKLADTAVTLVGSYGIKQGVDPLLRILNGNDILGARRSLRMKAIRALGELGDTRALQHLERFFSHSLLPWPSKQERYVAWQSLQKYPPEARMPFVEKGLRSRDPQVRAICRSLAKE